MRTLRTLLPWLGALGIIIGSWYVAARPPGDVSKPNGGPGAPAVVPVTTTRVHGGSAGRPVHLTGAVHADRWVTLSAETSGVVESVAADAGQEVEVGQELLRLRRQPLELARQEAEAAARAADARVAELRAGTRAEEVSRARAEHAAAVQTLALAEEEFARATRLHAAQVIHRSDLDLAQREVVRAQGAKNVAKAGLDLAHAGARSQQRAAAQAEAERARATVARLTDQIERSALVAPFAGVIAARRVEEGAWVAPGTPLFDLSAVDRVRVRVDASERLFGRVAEGAEVELSFDAVPGWTVRGVVARRFPVARAASRTFAFEVDLPNAERRVAPGMLARVQLVADGTQPAAVLVHRDALVDKGGEITVFRLGGDPGAPVAEAVPVKRGRYFGEAVEVSGALREGERVIVRGNERLRPGQPVAPDRFDPR